MVDDAARERVDGRKEARAPSRAGIGRMALLDNEVGREKIHVIFGRRYHRNTDAQYHTAIATLFFRDVASFGLLEFLGLDKFSGSFSFASTACTASILLTANTVCDEA
jgi:hypothetical protein